MSMNKQNATKAKGDLYSYKYFEKRLQFKAQFIKADTNTVKSFAYGYFDLGKYVVQKETMIKAPFKKYSMKNIEGKVTLFIQACETELKE